MIIQQILNDGPDEPLKLISKTIYALFQIPQDFQQQISLSQELLAAHLQNLQQYIELKLIQIPYKKIFNNEGKIINFINEGFKNNEDSITETESDGELLQPRKNSNPKQRQQTNQDKENIEIKRLNQKVVDRDNQICEMTMGYLKDIQHLKTMFMRQLANPDEDIFEVNYFDVNQGLDQEVKNYISLKLDDAAEQYRKKLQDFKLRQQLMQAECDSYRRTIQIFLQKNDLSSIVKTLITVEKDIYKIYRHLQDNIGNSIIFQVFENPKFGYGINYQEIDQLLLKGQAQQKIIQRQKQQNDHQIRQLTDSLKKIINDLQKENSILKKEYTIQQDSIQKIKDEVFNEIYEKLEQDFIDKLRSLKDEQIKESKQFAKSLLSIDQQAYIKKIIYKAALMKWVYYNRIAKLQENEGNERFKMELINQLQSQPVNFIYKELDRLKEKYKNLEIYYHRGEKEIQLMQQEQKVLRYYNSQLLFTNQMQQQQIDAMKRTSQNMEFQISILQKPFQQIMKRMGFNLDLNILSVRSINLMQSGLDMVEFIQNLNKLESIDVDEIQQQIDVYLKGSIVKDLINPEKLQDNKECQTDLFDTTLPLTNQIYIPLNQSNQTTPMPPSYASNNKENTIFTFKEQQLQQEQFSDTQQQQQQQMVQLQFQNKEEQQPQILKNALQTTFHFETSIQPISPKYSKEKLQKQRASPRIQRQQTMLNRKKSQDKSPKQIQVSYHTPKHMLDSKQQSTKFTQTKLEFNSKETQTNQFQKDNMMQLNPDSSNLNESQDLILIMSNRKNKQRSQTSHRREEFKNSFEVRKDENKRSKHRGESILQVARKKTQIAIAQINKAQQSNSPEPSERKVNPFQFYMDQFNEKKRLKINNHTILCETKIDKLIEEKKRRIEHFPTIYGKPLVTPILFK